MDCLPSAGFARSTSGDFMCPTEQGNHAMRPCCMAVNKVERIKRVATQTASSVHSRPQFRSLRDGGMTVLHGLKLRLTRLIAARQVHRRVGLRASGMAEERRCAHGVVPVNRVARQATMDTISGCRNRTCDCNAARKSWKARGGRRKPLPATMCTYISMTRARECAAITEMT